MPLFRSLHRHGVPFRVFAPQVSPCHVQRLLAIGLRNAALWGVEGRVVGVSDGDTITVLDRAKVQHKLRLVGIDAPEKGQALGEHSNEGLSRLVFDPQMEAHCHKRDRYGREVCKVMRAGTDVSLEQVGPTPKQNAVDLIPRAVRLSGEFTVCALADGRLIQPIDRANVSSPAR